MPLPQYVTRRGQRLWYRRAWPQEVWSVTGKSAFAVSLRTADPREAARARVEAERRYYAKLDEARAALARQSNMPPLTHDAARTLAVRWFIGALDKADEWRQAMQPLDVDAAIEDARWAEAEARRALSEGDLGDKWRLARCLRESHGLGPEGSAEAALVQLLGRAAVALHQVEEGRVVGHYGARPSDPLFAAAMEAPEPAIGTTRGQPQGTDQVAAQAAPERTVADLEETFRADRFPHVSVSAVSAYEPVLRLLRETLGAEKALASITHEDGQRLFKTVQGIPANANKRAPLRGLPLREQIEKGKLLGLPTLSAKTVNDGYMANLGTLFRFAQDRGWMGINPVRGLRVRDTVAPQDRREPFRHRIPALFAAAPWTPRDATGEGRPVRYWGPLLALFHGLRLAEIAGLQIGDIRNEDGRPMLYVREGQRTLKTRGSRRDMPVHPELVALGFVEFVEGRRTAGAEALLFDGEGPNSRGQWGRQLSRWFAKRARDLGMEGRLLTFHALRHDFRDALREGGVEEGLADYLHGHAVQGVRGIYGGQRPYSAARLAEAMTKVRYPGLKIPGP